MELLSLTMNTASVQLLRGLRFASKAIRLIMVPSLAFLTLALCGHWFSVEIHGLTGDAYRSSSFESVCAYSSFDGFPSEEKERQIVGSEDFRSRSDGNLSWSLDKVNFGLLNGKTLSCSLSFRDGRDDLSLYQVNAANQIDFSSRGRPLDNHKSTMFMQIVKSSAYDGSLEISSPVLYFPSVAFVIVTNTDSHSILHIYEPFSTDSQFYSCNFSGEVASVCFVFLPRRLGSSSARLILQTSFDGFLVKAKGVGTDSPYGIQSLPDFDDSSNPQVEISCRDVIKICTSHQKDSSGIIESGNTMKSGLHSSPVKVLGMAKPGASVVAGRKSQGTKTDVAGGSLTIKPGESMKVLISYQADFYFSASTAMVHRDLELALTTGTLVIPMKAILPTYMLGFCKKSMFWLRVKKLLQSVLIAAFLMILVFFLTFIAVIALGCSPDFLCKSKENSVPVIRSEEKSSDAHIDGKIKKSCENGLLKSVEVEEPRIIKQDVKFDLLRQNQTIDFSHTVKKPPVDDFYIPEEPRPDNLTVRTGNEKKKKRRKRKKGAISELTGLFDVSSSQSGNSTPSSSLSMSPKEIQNPFMKVTNKTDQVLKHVENPAKAGNKPVLLPSATKTDSNAQYTSFLPSTSRLALHDRAPGPKRRSKKDEDEKPGIDGGFIYDIWGDHYSRLFPLHNDYDSESFFVSDPCAQNCISAEFCMFIQ